MIGATELLELRRNGRKPRSVFLYDSIDPGRHTQWVQELIENGMIPEVYILPDENISRLDLRFLVGLNVLVYGPNKDRLRLLFERVRALPAQQITITDGETFATQWPKRKSE